MQASEGRVTYSTSRSGYVATVVEFREVIWMKGGVQDVSNIYKLACESALAGIAIADLEGELCKVNPAFLDLWGYEEDEVIDRSVAEFWEDPAKAASVAEHVIEHGEWEGTLVAETKDGSTFEARVSASTVRNENGEPAYIMSSFIDISDRISRERELQHKNEQLEQFASVISHDLRNPLNVAQGYIEWAQTEHESEHLAEAESALERAQIIIDDVLTLAREGEEVGETELVSLANVIDTCWETVETKEATLAIETRKTIQADRSRLRQVLENLLRNGVEHGGDNVTVSVGDLENGFYVADDGPGIPEGEREHVFEPGYSSSSKGTGLGLEIVKQIIDAHGWNIRVTESEAGGATFEITGVESPDE
jgi:PAS domain S-box-containing protein